eukprot:c15768_g1_i1.p1 GENE.c15768_g1_i1~~c15768_g1_i1.p1  ORF type:complete len:531 (+),score=105.31 c15768_g1_i1:38-1594(+)
MSGTGSFVNASSLTIVTRHWLPESDQARRGVVFLIHGFGEHSGRYHHVAARFVEAGLCVFALDHQGHGLSEGPRAYVEEFDFYIRDVLHYIDQTLSQDSGVSLGAERDNVFVCGHSMGGLIAIRTSNALAANPAILHGASFRGTVISGALLVPDPKAASPALIGVVKVLSKLTPRLPIQPVDPSAVSRDAKVIDAYAADPLVFADKVRARWIGASLTAMANTLETAQHVTWPYIFVQGGADLLCNKSGAEKFHELTQSSDKTLKIYPGMFHEIFNEPEHPEILSLVVQWVLRHLPEGESLPLRPNWSHGTLVDCAQNVLECSDVFERARLTFAHADAFETGAVAEVGAASVLEGTGSSSDISPMVAALAAGTQSTQTPRQTPRLNLLKSSAASHLTSMDGCWDTIATFTSQLNREQIESLILTATQSAHHFFSISCRARHLKSPITDPIDHTGPVLQERSDLVERLGLIVLSIISGVNTHANALKSFKSDSDTEAVLSQAYDGGETQQKTILKKINMR